MQTNRSLYEILGLPQTASQEDIRKAHRRLVREYHPDANPGDHAAEERFKEIQQAYEILSEPEKRREYDERHNERHNRASGSRSGKTGTGATAGQKTSAAGRASNPGAREDRNYTLRGEDLARVAGILRVDVSRLSRLAGEDITRASKRLGENLRARTAPGDGRSSGERSRGSREPQGGAAESNKASGKEKKVKGPKARKREQRGHTWSHRE